MKRFFVSLCLLLTTASFSSAQTAFQNLDFESFFLLPTLPIFPNPPPVAELPGWDITIGFISNDSLAPDRFLNTTAPVNGLPLAGSTSVVLGPGVDSPTFIPQNIGISQTGFVPTTSRSIQLLSSAPPIQEVLDFGAGNPAGTPTGVFETLWSLSLGGDDILLTEISPGQWAGEIDPNLAGSVELLAIDINSSFADFESPQFQQLVSFDNISFSSEAVGVPEPNSTLLVVTGLFVFVSRRRRPLL